MASKLIVAAAITLNAVLWSQSRYATSQQFQYGPPLSFRGNTAQQSPGVTRLFARHWDSGYVSSNVTLVKPDGDIFAESRTFIGITASDFFCPNLNTIAKVFGLSDNITGVTFLAFGNGSPDVFSTYSAMRSNTGSLAIGELLGAASFVVSVVVGSMCIVKPFHVRRGPFLRDVGFFSAAVFLLLLILYDGKIEAWEAGSLITLYSLYVAAVIVGTWWTNRKKAQREREERVREEYASESPDSSYMDEEPYRDDPTTPSHDSLGPAEPRRRARSHPTLPHLHETLGDPSRRLSSSGIQPSPLHTNILNRDSHSALPSFSLIGALEFRSVVNELQKASNTEALAMFDTPNTPSSAGRYIRRMSRPMDSRRSSQVLARSRSGTNMHDLEQDPWDRALAGAGAGSSKERRSPISSPGPTVDGDRRPLPAENEVARQEPISPRPHITIVPSTPADLGATVDLPLPSPTLSPGSSLGELAPRGRQPLPPFSTSPVVPRLPREHASLDGASFALGQSASETVRKEHRKAASSLLTATSHIFRTLFPTLQNFSSPHKSWAACIVGVVAAPAVLLLTVTLPVVITGDDEEMPELPPHKDNMSVTEGRLVDMRRASEEHLNGNPHYSLSHAVFQEDGIRPDMDLHREENDEQDGESDVSSIVSDIEKEMHGVRFDKTLLAIQCVAGPMFVVTVLLSQAKYRWIFTGASVIVGIFAACLVSVFVKNGRNPSGRIARSLMGFAVAIVWIMAIADEVVQVLQTFGFIFGLSNAIVGLTIFAVGNSVADLIANLSVAVFAPVMGFSACFGGPMLNILLGVGISSSIVLHQRGQSYYPINFSTTLLVSSIGLLTLLLVTMIFLPLNGYWLSKRWGIFLITCYAVIMTVNVVVEIKSKGS
ncbi:hypothetical protein FRB98_006470 [Tulasnella sp. 332]|nr:hypothetical protein FRB98_006470 [Tulasnella sp. 332]